MKNYISLTFQSFVLIILVVIFMSIIFFLAKLIEIWESFLYNIFSGNSHEDVKLSFETIKLSIIINMFGIFATVLMGFRIMDFFAYRNLIESFEERRKELEKKEEELEKKLNEEINKFREEINKKIDEDIYRIKEVLEKYLSEIVYNIAKKELSKSDKIENLKK